MAGAFIGGFSMGRDPFSVPGTSTGSGIYFGGDVGADIRGGRTPFDDSETLHSAFEADTAELSGPLQILSQRMNAGDAQASAQFNALNTEFQNRKRFYDIAWSEGLNDKNALDASKYALSTVDAKELGGAAPSYFERMTRYLSRQAVKRGTHVNSMLASEDAMHNAFTGSYIKSLDDTRTSGSSDLSQKFRASQGALAETSLRMREALSEWEGNDRLRDDRMRCTILAEAGRQFAYCMSTPGLERFTTRPTEIIDAAARAVGAVDGTQSMNRFDGFRRAVDAVNSGRVLTYTGSADGDILGGMGPDGKVDGRTALYRHVREALIDFYGRNIANGRDARDMGDEENVKQFEQDLVDRFGTISANAYRAQGGIDFFRDTAKGITKQLRGGNIALDQLVTQYNAGSATITPQAPFSTNVEAMNLLLNEIDDIALKNIGERATWKSNFWTTGSFAASEPMYTADGLKKDIDGRFTRLVDGNPKVAFDKDLLENVKQFARDYILQENTNWDSKENDYAYAKQALREMVGVMGFVSDLKKAGVLSTDWKPDVSTDDYKAVRPTYHGRSNRYLQTVYGKLSKDLDAFVESTRGVNLDEVKDQEAYRRIQLALEAKKGVDYMMRTANEGHADGGVSKANRELADKVLGRRGDIFDLNGMAGLKAAVTAHNDKILSSAFTLRPGTDVKAAAGRLFWDEALSDVTNPQFAKRAESYAQARIAEIGKDLPPAQQRFLKDSYRWTVYTAMKLAMKNKSVNPEAWNQDNVLTETINPYLRDTEARIQGYSEATRLRAMSEDLQKYEGRHSINQN